MAFDVRVGLYDDPPDKDTVKFVQATVDALALQGKLSRGWGSLFWKFFTTQHTGNSVKHEIPHTP